MTYDSNDPAQQQAPADRMKAGQIRRELHHATGSRRTELLDELRHRQAVSRTDFARTLTYFAVALTAFAFSRNEDLDDMSGMLVLLGGLFLASGIVALVLSVRAMYPDSLRVWQRPWVTAPRSSGSERAAGHADGPLELGDAAGAAHADPDEDPVSEGA
jgi:hypothetical protein